MGRVPLRRPEMTRWQLCRWKSLNRSRLHSNSPGGGGGCSVMTRDMCGKYIFFISQVSGLFRRVRSPRIDKRARLRFIVSFKTLPPPLCVSPSNVIRIAVTKWLPVDFASESPLVAYTIRDSKRFPRKEPFKSITGFFQFFTWKSF